jgi:tetratricopeptide (TPR) repeat protein
VNGEEAARLTGVTPPKEPHFGVHSRYEARFAVDQLVASGPAGRAAERDDTAQAARLWRQIERLRGERAVVTVVDRLRDLYLRFPDARILDLLYREAVRAGDPETALAVADAQRVMTAGAAGVGAAGGPGPAPDIAKLRIMALLMSRHWDEALGSLQRFRAETPNDPFGLENVLLLLDRTGDHERLLGEYHAARVASEPVRATSHGVAAWAYHSLGMPERAMEMVRAGLRLGPERLDLTVVEGDVLWKRGDVGGALARYSKVLASPVPSIPEENLRARVGLLRFEMTDYADAERVLASLPPDPSPAVRRARTILRAHALYRTGEARGEVGRRELVRALQFAQEEIGDSLDREDAILFDLVGRVRGALAVLDLQEGDSFPVYRQKQREALDAFRRAASLDPAFPMPVLGGEEVPDLDPARFRALIEAARPQDHPVGGFVEDPTRWYSWYVAERRAELAERGLKEMFEGDGGR